jgi:hypothetical protein
MTDLAVIIVTWNVRALVLDALRSLYADLAEARLSASVHVVDSASEDGTVEAVRAAFPQVNIIASAENLGFGRANNLGLRELGFGRTASTPPPVVYLLNPDTIPQPGSTRALYDALMSDARVGMVGARLSYGDGSFQHSAFAFPGLRQLYAEFFPMPGRLREGRFNGRYPRQLYAAGQPFPVDFVLGATMMLRREVIETVGMFDELFFMYCEEIDWQWRMHPAGWSIRCVPSAHVVHLGGQSTGQVRPQSLINLWTSRLLLYRKHYPPWKLRLARWLVAAGMRAKMAQVGAAEQDALLPAYQSILSLAGNP